MEKIIIWQSETGITGLDERLASFDENAQSIADAWQALNEKHKNNANFQKYLDRIKREWALWTGEIEGAYHFRDRGITTTLIDKGFKESYIAHGATNIPASDVIAIMKDHENALELVYDFIKSNRALSTSFIKELHVALMNNQDTAKGRDHKGKSVEIPLKKGDWKTAKNNPQKDGAEIFYCPPEQTASEIDRLLALHAEHEAKKIPPIVQAAWLHHRFTQIHPFQDGNGRVVRALASAILIKAGFFPLTIDDQRRADYIDNLELADAGDLEPLITLFSHLQKEKLQELQNLQI